MDTIPLVRAKLVEPNLEKRRHSPRRQCRRDDGRLGILIRKQALPARPVPGRRRRVGRGYSGELIPRSFLRVAGEGKAGHGRLVEIEHVADAVPAPRVGVRRVGVGPGDARPIVSAHDLRGRCCPGSTLELEREGGIPRGRLGRLKEPEEELGWPREGSRGDCDISGVRPCRAADAVLFVDELVLLLGKKKKKEKEKKKSGSGMDGWVLTFLNDT